MLAFDSATLLAIAAVITSLSTLVWSFRRKV